jgi:hypothetical protein
MKKPIEKAAEPALRDEYDFSPGVRGRHAQRYAQGIKGVGLKAAVPKVSPHAGPAQESPRALAGIIRRRSKVLAAK